LALLSSAVALRACPKALVLRLCAVLRAGMHAADQFSSDARTMRIDAADLDGRHVSKIIITAKITSTCNSITFSSDRNFTFRHTDARTRR
jgi:hypothetical protein